MAFWRQGLALLAGGASVLAYAPRRPAGEAYRALWLELLGRLIPRQE